jgi:CheY-like chemotaxis protein
MIRTMSSCNVSSAPRRKANQVVLLKDEDDSRARVEEGLRRVGMETLAVQSGDEYLACVRDHNTSLAVLDVFMHRTDALRMLLVTRQLRPNLPMIVITQAPVGTLRAVPLDTGIDDDSDQQEYDPTVIADCIQACLESEVQPKPEISLTCPSKI